MNKNETQSEIQWTHLTAVTNEDLTNLSTQTGFPPQLIQDCLQPEHLPKLEKVDDTLFSLLRYYDNQCSKKCNTIQLLTRKVAVFMHADQVLSLQRSHDQIFSDLKQHLQIPAKVVNKQQYIFLKIFKRVLMTYEDPIQEGLAELENFETSVFESESRKMRVSRFYALKRRMTVFASLIRMSEETLHQFSEYLDKSLKSVYQDVKELIARLLFKLKELNESLLSLINLYVSISSHRLNELSHKTNEIMRVLTIFSVFFLPLNFIAGLYGMNFEHMPELKWEHGYLIVIISMMSIVLGLFVWFWKKGWLRE